MFVGEGSGIDFARCAVVALSVTASRDYSLPFSLERGQYRVLVYDIERGGILDTGLSYPAVESDRTIINQASSGMILLWIAGHSLLCNDIICNRL